MSGIKRWGVISIGVKTCTMSVLDDGDYVLHGDHEKVLEEVQLLWANELVKRDNEIARLRAEADANRVDAERYRWLSTHDSPNLGPHVVIYLNEFAEDHSYLNGEDLDAAIDAAMGADA